MRKELMRLIIGFLFFVIGISCGAQTDIGLISFIVGYLILGIDVIFKAIRNIIKGKVFDEHLLMSIATLGAFILKEYPEGVAVMLFYQVGELFQDYASEKSKKSIKSLLDIRPDYANLMIDGKPQRVSPEEVKIGDTIIVKPGEKVPLDSLVLDGVSTVDTSVLTGESVPRTVKRDSKVLSGCINLSGTLFLKVEKAYGESTVSKILDLVQNATEKKAQTERFITKFAKYYTPIVILIAMVIAFIPPLIITGAVFHDYIYRALVFLVISCPCALVISIPLSFFCGIGCASKNGILIKGSNYIEELAVARTIVFDKTGTLTKGIFAVTKIRNIGIDRDEFLKYAAHAEIHSSHPIALSIRKAYDRELDNNTVSEVEELAGYGVKAIIFGKEVCLGNKKFMEKIGAEVHEVSHIGSIVHMSIDGKYAGYAVISDKLKEDAKEAIIGLRKVGIDNIAMLTGDSKNIGEAVAKDLGLDYVAAELLPMDKLNEVNKLQEETKEGTLIFVGDGINDAPVLAQSDIGIAMGALGSDAAVETADIVIMDDKPSKVADAIRIARNTIKIAKQNIIFSLGIKFAVLLLGAFGLASMWSAVFADVGVSVIAVLNSMRSLKYKKS